MVVLRYRGEGVALIGVPARDLTDEDVRERQLDAPGLVASGLYEWAETKARRGGAENKGAAKEQ